MARKGNAALALAAGLGGGYFDQQDRARKQALEDQDRAAKEEDRAYLREQRDRERQQQVSLANAARPATVNEGATLDMGDGPKTYDDASAAGSDFRQARSMGLADVQAPSSAITVQGKAYGSRPEADAAAAAYNDPTARRTRQADALDAAGKPGEALSLQNATMSQNALRRKEADDVWRQKVGTAIQGGHEGLAQLATQTEVGPLAGKKVRAVPSPDGKTVNYSVVGDDGSLTPTQFNFPNDQTGVIQAGYLMDRAITPEHRMEGVRKDKELERKTAADENKAAYQSGLIDTKIKQLELTGQIAEARALAAAAKASAGGGAVGKEERLRYTSLFSEAGRRIAETQKAIGTLTRGTDGALFNNAVAKNPAGPEAQQLKQLQEDLATHNQERSLYQGLLAGSQGPSGKPPSLADAKPAAGQPAKPTSKAEYDKLPKGTRYVHPDGTTRVKG